MHSSLILPRLTNYNQLAALVLHLRNEGVADNGMAVRISQIGHVDLDTLNAVLRNI